MKHFSPHELENEWEIGMPRPPLKKHIQPPISNAQRILEKAGFSSRFAVAQLVSKTNPSQQPSHSESED